MNGVFAKRWMGASGLVHVIRLPEGTWTYCGYLVEVSVSEVTRHSRYTRDSVTCLQCLVRSPGEQHHDD